MHFPAIGRRPFPVADRSRDGEPYRHMHPRLAAIDLLQDKIADGTAGLDPYDHQIFVLVALPHETVWANVALRLVGDVLGTPAALDGGGRRFRATIADDVRAELGLDRVSPPLMEDEPLASRSVWADAPRPYGFSDDQVEAAEAIEARISVREELEPTPTAAEAYNAKTAGLREALELVKHGPDARLLGDEKPVPVMRSALDRAAHLAALRVECGCGAPAKVECGCDAADRMASALVNRAPVLNCPTCHGTGGGIYNDCPTCDGNGEI